MAVSWLHIFQKPPTPCASLTDKLLGPLVWSKDANAWQGTFQGFEFLIPYERQAIPNADIVEYAARTLGNVAWLMDTLEQEKSKWQSRYPTHTAEIAVLHFELFSFYRNKKGFQLFAILAPESRDRLWRIEYSNDTCMGLGFDS